MTFKTSGKALQLRRKVRSELETENRTTDKFQEKKPGNSYREASTAQFKCERVPMRL